MNKLSEIANKLILTNDLLKDELVYLISNIDDNVYQLLRNEARKLCDNIYGKKIFIRGLIEISNYCKNNCYYCGIRRENNNVQRYRLTESQILNCCEIGYDVGFRTFVLQGGEDLYFTDERLVNIIKNIKSKFGDCAITLSIGERNKQSYEKLYDAGTDRFLLREETADYEHYNKLHPDDMSYEKRIECLHNLNSIGYQTGCGFLVGSPYQTVENIAKDLCFLKKFNPHMIGIGPFISHCDTPFRNQPNGSYKQTLLLISIIRLLIPKVLLPATTALNSIVKGGRELGILHGANVLMPNLSPQDVRCKYMLYNNKLSQGVESAEGLKHLDESLRLIGYHIVVDRGDSLIEYKKKI